MNAPKRNRRIEVALILLGCLAAGVAGWLTPHAQSQDHNFAGSLQTNYMWVGTDPNARDHTFDGFTNELSLKVSVDFSDHVSANVKLCYGCHGVELGMAFVDIRVADQLNFRVGRFSPSFGDFILRHDPANHRTADKPLPYDMGRMLRLREYNLGVLPSPYVDQGIEVSGMQWLGRNVQIDYALYAVSGLRAGQDDMDLDFVARRSNYYIDNNSEPAVGARLAVTVDITDDVLLTVGSSAMAGRPDPNRERKYLIVGADVYLRLGKLDLHAEYLLRRTQFAVGDDPDSRFRYGPGENGVYDDYFVKDGFYIESNYLLSSRLELVGRFDGLRRIGNVPIHSPLRARSGILRYTAGFNILLDGSVRLKVSGEFYDFSDFSNDFVANLGAAAAF